MYDFLCNPHVVPDCNCSSRLNLGPPGHYKSSLIEWQTLSAIKALLPDHVMYTHQFYINGVEAGRTHSYLIDLYFPDHRIAVECDEHGHRDRNKTYEADRQKFITDKLGCVFVRYNPHDRDYTPEAVADRITAAVTAVKEDAEYRLRRQEMLAWWEQQDADAKKEAEFTQYLHDKYTSAGLLPHVPEDWPSWEVNKASSIIDDILLGDRRGSVYDMLMPYSKRDVDGSVRLMQKTQGGAREWPYAIPDGLPTPRGYRPPEVILQRPTDAVLPDLMLIFRRQTQLAQLHYKDAMLSCRAIEAGDPVEVHDSVFKTIAEEAEAGRITCCKGVDNLIKKAYGDWSKVPEAVSSVIPSKYRSDVTASLTERPTDSDLVDSATSLAEPVSHAARGDPVPGAQRSLADRIKSSCFKYCKATDQQAVLDLLTSFWDGHSNNYDKCAVDIGRLVFTDAPVDQMRNVFKRAVV